MFYFAQILQLLQIQTLYHLVHCFCFSLLKICNFCNFKVVHFSSIQSLSRVQLFATPCSTPGLPVNYQLPELAQTHVHRVSDAIQLSHLLSSPSSPAFNLFQHQGLFQ